MTIEDSIQPIDHRSDISLLKFGLSLRAMSETEFSCCGGRFALYNVLAVPAR